MMPMAVKQIMIDDIDGSEGAETVEFSLEGIGYQIDLTEKNADALRKALAPFIDSARRTSAKRPSSRKTAAHRPAAEATINNDAIRDWAKSTGRKVSDRGRIPRDVVQAFEEAHAPADSSKMFSAASA
jgi:hypothetical protein